MLVAERIAAIVDGFRTESILSGITTVPRIGPVPAKKRLVFGQFHRLDYRVIIKARKLL